MTWANYISLAKSLDLSSSTRSVKIAHSGPGHQSIIRWEVLHVGACPHSCRRLEGSLPCSRKSWLRRSGNFHHSSTFRVSFARGTSCMPTYNTFVHFITIKTHFQASALSSSLQSLQEFSSAMYSLELSQSQGSSASQSSFDCGDMQTLSIHSSGKCRT